MKYATNEAFQKLASFDLGLPEEQLEKFFGICSFRTYEPNEYIFRSGRKDRKAILILQGSVRSFALIDGVEYNCHLRSVGYLMGDPRSFNEAIDPILDTVAINEVEALLLDVGDLEHLAKEDRLLMDYYLRVMKDVISVLAHRVFTFVSMDAKGRYNDLMQWSPDYLKNTYDKFLASFLGMRPVTYHRVKNK
jgi:signal-transduction protein with cAMP-binding, CBS, and nucleotidyltransferase domain